jgi:hypothetical protein
MKKILLLLLCVVCVLSVSAQEKKMQREYAVSPTIEASGSFNFAIYHKNDVKAIGIQRKLLGSAGLLLGCDFQLPHGVLMLQYGFLISNNDFSYGGYSHKLTFKSLALDMPLVLGYALRLNKNYSLSFSGGYVTKTIFKYDNGLRNSNDHLYAFGLYSAIGFCYHASPHFALRVEPFFEYFWMMPDYHAQLDYMAPAIIGLRMALKFNILKLKQ